jgi:hypothetical protein
MLEIVSFFVPGNNKSCKIEIPHCVTYDRYSQIAMNETNINYMLLSKFLYSGHTTLVLFSTGYRGRRGSWFAPNPGFHCISPGVIQV